MKRALVLCMAIALAACGQSGASSPDNKPVSFNGAEAAETEAVLEHGQRIVKILGCSGCHGKALTGQAWDDDPAIGRLWSPNLTVALGDYGDAALETVLREGKHPRRKDLWIMPSENFRFLSAADMHSMIAYLRTIRPVGDRSPLPKLGPGYRRDIAAGEMKPAAMIIAENPDVLPADAGPDHALGRYITSVTCAECHNLRLEGWEGDTPDLAIAAAYSPGQFRELMQSGKSLTGRDLGLMKEVARNRFSNLTSGEVDAVYAYLRARAALPDPAGVQKH